MILNSTKHRCNQSHGFSEGCFLTSNGPSGPLSTHSIPEYGHLKRRGEGTIAHQALFLPSGTVELKHAIGDLPDNNLKYIQKNNRFLWSHLVTEATIVVLYVRHWAALMGILLTVTQRQMSLIACFSSPSYNWGSIGKNLHPGYIEPHAVSETSKGRQLWASGKGFQSV